MTTQPPATTPNKGLVTIVLPAKNEEAALAHTLRALPISTLEAAGYQTEIFVLDGNSTDATPRIARQWGAIVVEDTAPGKGSALRNARPQFRGDYVVMLDADGTYAPDTIPRVVALLAEDGVDVVTGVREPQPGAMTGAHVVGNVLLSLIASTLYTRNCPDVCTGLWGFRGDVLRALPLRSNGFGLEAELFGLTARLDLNLARVSVDYLPRKGLTNLRSGRDSLRILRRLMRSRLVPLPENGLATALATNSMTSQTDEVHA